MIIFEIVDINKLRIKTDEEIILESTRHHSLEPVDLYTTNLTPGMFSIINHKNNDIIFRIRKVVDKSIMTDNRYNKYVTPLPEEYYYNKKTQSISRINLNKNNLYKQMKHQPILIGGLVGGGTSYIAKLLRFSGLFLGDDINDINARKFNESLFFRDITKLITNRFSGIFIDNKYMEGTLSDTYINDIDNSCNDNIIKNEFINQIEYRFSSYLGDINNTDKIWGWKIPQNTKLSKFYKIFWPELKLVVIHRDKFKSSDYKTTGNIFSRNIEKYNNNLEKWYDVPHISEKNQLHVDFKELCTNYIKFNELLEFCQLKTINEQMFNFLLAKTRFEKDKI